MDNLLISSNARYFTNQLFSSANIYILYFILNNYYRNKSVTKPKYQDQFVIYLYAYIYIEMHML